MVVLIGTAQLRQAPGASPGLLARSDVFEGYTVFSSPIGIFAEGRWDIDLLGFTKEVVELLGDQRRSAPGEEFMSSDRKLLGRDLPIPFNHALGAERLED